MPSAARALRNAGRGRLGRQASKVATWTARVRRRSWWPRPRAARSRTAGTARYRQRLVFVFAVRDRARSDDPEVRIERHVLVAGSCEVGEVADAVMSRPLARDRPLWVKTMVPVSVRGDAGDGELDNRICFLFTELPCAQAEPLVRLVEIDKLTAQRKAADEPAGSDAALQAVAHVPRMLQHAASRLVAAHARPTSSCSTSPDRACRCTCSAASLRRSIRSFPGGRPRALDRHDHGPTHRVLPRLRLPQRRCPAPTGSPNTSTTPSTSCSTSAHEPRSAPLGCPDRCPRVSPTEG